MPVPAPLRVLGAALLALSASPALALVVPLKGWTPVGGNAGVWADASGACLIREERHGQALPAFATQAAARTFAVRLQRTLSGQKAVSEVVTQPAQRGETWAVLAAYALEANGVTYRISQLYLSDAGLLRTVTGSSAQHEASPCVNEMREFLRHGAK
ncbi:hypothetical protein RDMS_07335 [Deinococcus sp. RL]|uniref:hypothetical protein n=1 Tax=Deinococcus sp. RL TaxID=1489678 RepID=UPI0004D82825|nr:hypothetical protein [Deinococcus sp. RL]KEF34452.1 hypothetical protein RDMS_07335 [Deinococcus sp. RL]